jgi:RES domain-containing protein
MGSKEHTAAPVAAPPKQEVMEQPGGPGNSWLEEFFAGVGGAGAAGRNGAVSSIHQFGYMMGLDAPHVPFSGDVYRNVPTPHAPTAFNASFGASGGGRYNPPGQQLVYTSPTAAESVGEAGAYKGMADRTLIRSQLNTGNMADVSKVAGAKGMTGALTPHVGSGPPPLAYRIAGEHPYTLTQNVGKGVIDSGASAMKVPSATGGHQVNVIPRNSSPGAITPLETTPYNAAGVKGPVSPATAISPLAADASVNRPGPIDVKPGETVRPAKSPTDRVPGRSGSLRYGLVGGAAVPLVTDLGRMAMGQDVSAGDVAKDTAIGTAAGGTGAMLFDGLRRTGLTNAKAGGVVGGLLEGGMSAWDNANAYRDGKVSGAQATANVAVDAGIGVGAGMAGAAMGAAIGSIIPGAGTAVGAGLGFLGGMAGSWLAHTLADKTGFAATAKEKLGSGIQWAADGVGKAGGAVVDGAKGLWKGITGGWW